MAIAPMTLRLAVLASGRGSNLRAVLQAIAAGALDARVVGVFSDKAHAGALDVARAAGVPAKSFDPRAHAGRIAFDEAMFSAVDAVQPDLIVMAGYMRLVSDAAVTARLGRMLNIHPSLLPAFKGLHTHARALAAGVPVHGASVHVVTPALDDGPVLAQAHVPVRAGDSAADLAQRVLAREHPLLVATLQAFARGRMRWSDGAPHLDGAPLARPLRLGDDDQLHDPAHDATGATPA